MTYENLVKYNLAQARASIYKATETAGSIHTCLAHTDKAMVKLIYARCELLKEQKRRDDGKEEVKAKDGS